MFKTIFFNDKIVKYDRIFIHTNVLCIKYMFIYNIFSSRKNIHLNGRLLIRFEDSYAPCDYSMVLSIKHIRSTPIGVRRTRCTDSTECLEATLKGLIVHSDSFPMTFFIEFFVTFTPINYVGMKHRQRIAIPGNGYFTPNPLARTPLHNQREGEIIFYLAGVKIEVNRESLSRILKTPIHSR